MRAQPTQSRNQKRKKRQKQAKRTASDASMINECRTWLFAKGREDLVATLDATPDATVKHWLAAVDAAGYVRETRAEAAELGVVFGRTGTLRNCVPKTLITLMIWVSDAVMRARILKEQDAICARLMAKAGDADVTVHDVRVECQAYGVQVLEEPSITNPLRLFECHHGFFLLLVNLVYKDGDEDKHALGFDAAAGRVVDMQRIVNGKAQGCVAPSI